MYLMTNTFTPVTLPAPPSTDELIRSAVDLARACLGMDVGFVTEFRDGLRIFRHVASVEDFTPIRVGDCNPLDESYCQHVVSGAIPAMVADSYEHPVLVGLAATDALKIRAHLGVPIRFSNGKVFGTFCCYSRDPHVNLSSFNVEAMTRFAALIGQLLEGRVLAERNRDLLVARIRGVITQHQVSMVYQPVFDVVRQALLGYEALARFAAEPLRSPDLWFAESE